MSEAPERIWTRQTSGWGELQRGVYQNAEMDGYEYRRADLPATDEHALANPKVQALVEALRPFARIVDKSTCKITMTWKDETRYTSTYTNVIKPENFYSARAALEAITSPSTAAAKELTP